MFRAKTYPTNYIQEPGILREIGQWTKKFGTKPLILAGPTAWSKAGGDIEQSLIEQDIVYQLQFFQGHCSDLELQRVLSETHQDIDIVIGVGGGQCLDTSKRVANQLNVPIITVSTLASTCAVSSALSIVYTPEHEFLRVEEFDRGPILALVDPDIIRDSPIRYLVAGIGDTVVKWYEAMPINEGKYQHAKTKAGLKIAELIRDLLFENSEQAIADCEAKITSDALRQVIDANVFLAGLVAGLGRETCASSGAHSIHYGMTTIPEVRKAYHGEIVAFGLLCQFMLEGKTDEEVIEMMKFYQKINLPISLFDLGMKELCEDQLRGAANKACAPEENIHSLPFPILEENVLESIIKAHQLGEVVKNR